MLGWFGNIFILWFLYTVPNGDRTPYIFAIIGSLLWFVQSIFLKDVALFTLQVVIIVINVKNYWNYDINT